MGQITDKINRFPFFIILIPVFFVLHGFLYYFGFIPATEALLLALYYSVVSIIVYLLFRLFYRRNRQKAAIIAGYLLMVYFFFGAYHDFFERHLPVLSHYSVLATVILLLLVFIVWRLKKSNSFRRIMMLLNLLFFVYIIIDSAMLIAYIIRPPASKFTVAAVNELQYKPVINPGKPDIYFLVFDEYASSLSLHENYGYNNDIDLYLEQKGFRVQKRSFSNYHYTPVSIASILNMAFITGLYDSSMLSAKDMNYCYGLIKYNEVCRFLSAQGYEIINCSHLICRTALCLQKIRYYL